jgi:hypothetical protein
LQPSAAAAGECAEGGGEGAVLLVLETAENESKSSRAPMGGAGEAAGLAGTGWGSKCNFSQKMRNHDQIWFLFRKGSESLPVQQSMPQRDTL